MSPRTTTTTTHTNGNGNGFAAARRWQLYASLALSLIAMVKVFFFAGGEEARIEDHLKFIDQRLDIGDREWARKDVLDQRIGNVEKSQAQNAKLLEDQTKILDRIEADVVHRR